MTEAEKAWEQHFIKLSYSADCNDPIGYFLSDFKASLKEAIGKEIKKLRNKEYKYRNTSGFDIYAAEHLEKVLALLETVKPKE